MAGGQKPKGLSRSCVLLIVISGMERFAFKGVASNLVTYLTDVVKMSNSSAAKTVNSWGGFTSMLPLLVAPLADSYWDRFSTILVSSFLYVLGLVGLTSTALAGSWSASKNNTLSSSFLFCSLCLISLGQGAYNPSLQAFGADQLDNDTDKELPTSKEDQKSEKKSLFFQLWYFGVCTGSLLGVTIMAYIQDTFGWVLGFAIPSGAMLVSSAFFMSGNGIYTYGADLNFDANPFQKILQTIKARASSLLTSRITLSNDRHLDIVELELQEKPLCQGSNAKGLDQEPSKTGFYFIRNTKIVLRLLPIWMMLLMFAVIFQQPATFFTKQGMTMKRNIGTEFRIPPATLQSAITLSIILLMPLYDKILIPITRTITRNENGITVMQRMGIGMFLSIIAMAIAAVVETKRLKISRNMNAPQLEPGTVPLSIFWLLPQYILLGISDIFTVVGMQEFFYSEVPVRMRTMGFALYTSVFGVGSFMSALLISVIETFSSSRGKHSWFSDDMTEARLDKYYWLLAFASALSLLLYIAFCKCYKRRSDLDDDTL